MSTDNSFHHRGPGLPHLGKALDIDLEFPLSTFLKFAEKHGKRGVRSHAIGVTPTGIAHRILVPDFGPMAIQSMISEMHEIATQLAFK